ncbi:sensor histidine kinase [Clostridium intestinale]|uniref:histidine kinase n=1 Tax=Clostridium intestinale DSM 6191 TaxID=1121320 RepID=A0A1M6ATL2_9CLOT|nr:sensor histidine kinase [Clostridium intestinale]SHI39815.1 Signal transduction histidine kinase [Clostridium intestinale DSM 6191]
MLIILCIVIAILICIILFQYFSQKVRNENLVYIKGKLKQILNDNSEEKILVVTDDKVLKDLLSEINKLLENNQMILAEYRKKEDSMRKMLSNISHDLKTPLTVVLGYIETINLDKSMRSDEKEVLLEKVHDKTIEVIDLINKFFDLAKLESGDKDISLTRININEVCRKNILNFYDILNSKGFEVDINIPEKDLYAFGNEEALDRILNNLLSNSVKYGTDGKFIGLSIEENEKSIYIHVIDKGRGIEEDKIDRVFERMYTLEDSRNRVFQGSGLGLTITKRLVEKMNGEIFLKSIPYKTTTFTVKLKIIDY